MKSDLKYDFTEFDADAQEIKKKKKFSWFRAISTTVLTLFIFGFLFYAFSIVFTQNKIDINNENYKYCLEKNGLSSPTWNTYTVLVSKEVDLSQERLWNTFIKLDNWKEWSNPLVENAQWIKGTSFKIDNEFSQKLNLGFPLGQIKSTEKIGNVIDGQSVAWWKEENGVKSCHIWDFKKIDINRTLITNLEIFHGTSIALAKPFISNSWQDLFEKSVDGIINEAKK